MQTIIQEINDLLDNQVIDFERLEKSIISLQNRIVKIEDKTLYKNHLDELLLKLQNRKVEAIKITKYELAANLRNMERKIQSTVSD